MILNLLKLNDVENVYVIGEKTLKANYARVIESWGAKFIELKSAIDLFH